jgi:hypothetical protein
MPVTVLVGHITEVTDEIGTHQLGRTAPDRVDLVTGFGYVLIDPGLDILVIFPLPVIFDNLEGRYLLLPSLLYSLKILHLL